jgi:hypothetical protein
MLLLEVGHDISHVHNLNEVLHLLVAVNYYHSTILSFLVFLQILLELLLSLLMVGYHSGNHGGFLCIFVTF